MKSEFLMQRKVDMKFLKAMGIAAAAVFVVLFSALLIGGFAVFLKSIIGPFFAIVCTLLLILFVCFTITAYNELQ